MSVQQQKAEAGDRAFSARGGETELSWVRLRLGLGLASLSSVSRSFDEQEEEQEKSATVCAGEELKPTILCDNKASKDAAQRGLWGGTCSQDSQQGRERQQWPWPGHTGGKSLLILLLLLLL